MMMIILNGMKFNFHFSISQSSISIIIHNNQLLIDSSCSENQPTKTHTKLPRPPRSTLHASKQVSREERKQSKAKQSKARKGPAAFCFQRTKFSFAFAFPFSFCLLPSTSSFALLKVLLCVYFFFGGAASSSFRLCVHYTRVRNA